MFARCSHSGALEIQGALEGTGAWLAADAALDIASTSSRRPDLSMLSTMDRARDMWSWLRPRVLKDLYPRDVFDRFPGGVFAYWAVWLSISVAAYVYLFSTFAGAPYDIRVIGLFLALVVLADQLVLKIPLEDPDSPESDAHADWTNRDLFIQLSVVLLAPHDALVVVAISAGIALLLELDWTHAIGYGAHCLLGGLAALGTVTVLSAMGATAMESPLWIPVTLVIVYVVSAIMDTLLIAMAKVMRSFDLGAFSRALGDIWAFYRTDAIVMQTTTQVSVMIAAALAYSGVAAWWAPALALVPCAVAWRASKQARALREATEAMFTDPLTGLLNRRGFSERAEQEIDIARQYRHPVYVAMADLDDFKQVNDTYGHDAGDGALLAIADVLTQFLRGRRDVPARFGGEEFVVLIPAVTAEEARATLEEIREEAAARLSSLGSSVSIGVAELGADEDVEAALARADEALYAAKRAGKNRVMFATDESTTEQLSEAA